MHGVFHTAMGRYRRRNTVWKRSGMPAGTDIGLHWRMAVGMAGNLWGRRKMGSTVGEKEKKGMKRILVLSMAMLAVLLFTGCAGGSDADAHMEGTQQMEPAAVGTTDKDSDDTESAQNEPETDGADRAVCVIRDRQASVLLRRRERLFTLILMRGMIMNFLRI